MVDSILAKKETDSDDELSGDEYKKPIFQITTVNDNTMQEEETKEPDSNTTMAGQEQVSDQTEPDDFNDEVANSQYEYDLETTMGQVVTRLDSVDEYDFFCGAIRQANPEYTQHLITHGLQTPTLRTYLKIILQSKRVLIPIDPKEQVLLPRRIVKAKRKIMPNQTQ